MLVCSWIVARGLYSRPVLRSATSLGRGRAGQAAACGTAEWFRWTDRRSRVAADHGRDRPTPHRSLGRIGPDRGHSRRGGTRPREAPDAVADARDPRDGRLRPPRAQRWHPHRIHGGDHAGDRPARTARCRHRRRAPAPLPAPRSPGARDSQVGLLHEAERGPARPERAHAVGRRPHRRAAP